MNWTKASAIAEILSSIAVLITLVYLLIELGQNTAALEAGTRQAALDNTLQTLQIGIDSPELWLSRTSEDLSDVERVRLSAFLLAAVRRFQVALQQNRAGALDDAALNDMRFAIVGNLQYVQAKKWWDYFGPSFPPDLQQEINEALSETEVISYSEDVRAFD